jgi:S-adenosyl-L-methionine hydrolase (adenosine-forming)
VALNAQHGLNGLHGRDSIVKEEIVNDGAPGLLTLLTDFGTADWYVAAVRGTVLRLAPGARLADISHEVPPGDVETAAFLLAAAAPTFPAGTVHLAVVDPGVGSERRLLAVATPAAVFLAPDNGLLTPFLEPGARMRSVERPDLYLSGSGSGSGRTFHGRDRFAPVAAALLRGEPFEALGPELPDPVRLQTPPPRREGSLLLGRVVHVDRYGNLVTDIPAAWLPDGPFLAEVGGHATAVRVTHYRELATQPAGTAGVLTGSLGTLELSLDGASLARSWQVQRGAEVRVTLGAAGTQ